MVKIPKHLGGKHTDEAITWFDKMYPRYDSYTYSLYDSYNLYDSL